MDAVYRSPSNRDVPPAASDEFAPIAIGPLRVWPPVVLAPMAGVTDPPFRTLCRRYGAGLYVSEMITARALVEGNRKTMLMASFGPEEATRSLQLYGVDPYHMGEATRLLVDEGRVGRLHDVFYTTTGNGTPVATSTEFGREIARELRDAGVEAVLLSGT